MPKGPGTYGSKKGRPPKKGKTEAKEVNPWAVCHSSTGKGAKFERCVKKVKAKQGIDDSLTAAIRKATLGEQGRDDLIPKLVKAAYGKTGNGNGNGNGSKKKKPFKLDPKHKVGGRSYEGPPVAGHGEGGLTASTEIEGPSLSELAQSIANTLKEQGIWTPGASKKQSKEDLEKLKKSNEKNPFRPGMAARAAAEKKKGNGNGNGDIKDSRMSDKFARVIKEKKESWKTWSNKWPKVIKMVKGIVDPKTGKWDTHGDDERPGTEQGRGHIGKVGRVPKWGETD